MSETSSPDDDDICEHDPDISRAYFDTFPVSQGQRISDEFKEMASGWKKWNAMLEAEGIDTAKSLLERVVEGKGKPLTLQRDGPGVSNVSGTVAPCSKCSKVLLILGLDSERKKWNWRDS